jgi:four helix bundle protein
MATAKRYQELVIWQLSVRLRDSIREMTSSGPAARDFKFLEQIVDASSSPPRNIAEGFGRFRSREFVYFLRVARGSLLETRNHLEDGLKRRYFTKTAVQPLFSIQKRAVAGVTRLIRYLETDGSDGPLDDPNP